MSQVELDAERQKAADDFAAGRVFDAEDVDLTDGVPPLQFSGSNKPPA